MACNSGPDIIEDGLVLCLDAANINSYPKSGATWSDLSGNGNHGALQNMENNFDAGNKGSLTFDGSNEYVDCGYPSISVGKLTVNAWIKLNAGNIFQHLVDSSSNSWLASASV